MTRRALLDTTARRGWLVLALVVVFLTIGVPRWLAGDDSPGGESADATFLKVCRDHGGMPATPRGSGTRTDAQRLCTVRYGARVYVMDAITPGGFDEDTARFQRQGCEEARRQQGAPTARRREAFVYHPTTGVCEHRP